MIILLLGGLLCGPVDAAQKIVVAQSLRIKPYEEALAGVEAACGVRVKRMVLSEMRDLDVVAEAKNFGPDLVVAIGDGALAAMVEIRNVPVVYCMVMDPAKVLGARRVPGVGASFSDEELMEEIGRVLPEAKRIGVLFDPAHGASLAARNRIRAGGRSFTIVSERVFAGRKVPFSVDRLKEGVDALWMVPGGAMGEGGAMEYLFRFSMEHRIPVVTYAPRFLAMGAMASVGVDPWDVGRQAGEMARGILAGRDPRMAGRLSPAKLAVKVNRFVADIIGAKLGKDFDDGSVRVAAAELK